MTSHMIVEEFITAISVIVVFTERSYLTPNAKLKSTIQLIGSIYLSLSNDNAFVF